MANPNIKDHAHKGGRPKGSKDKITRDLKKRVLDVWDQLKADGKDLHDEAQQDPKWFYQNFVKPMLPKDVVLQGDSENPLITEIIVKHVKTDA